MRCLFILIWIAPLVLTAQKENPVQDSIYLLTTKDGNQFVGTILEQDQERMIFSAQDLATLTVLKVNIKNLKLLDASARIVKGKVWLPNPQSSRYFFQPTGYNIKEGETYYQNYWILYNQLTRGITDHISIGVGLIPLFLFGNGASTPVWLTPKFSLPSKKENYCLGGGALIGGILGEESSGFGVVYAINTFGSRDKNISLGIGYGYSSDDWASRPTFTFSGMLRTGPRHYLVTENYFIPEFADYLGIYFFGGRAIVRKVGIDYGLVAFDEFGFAIPWLGVTVAIGD